MRIFTSVCRIDSIFNRNCFIRISSWGFIRMGVHKLIRNGLYLKKRSDVYRIETDGEGLYLGPVSGDGFESVGNGIYLMKQGDCMTVED